MPVVVRQCLTRGDDLIDTWTSPQQVGQRCLTFHNDGTSSDLDERRVANELDRVTQSLLGSNQECLLMEWLASPKRCVEISSGNEFWNLKAILIGRPTFWQSSHFQQRQGAGPATLDPAGIQLMHAFPAGQGLRQSDFLFQRHCQGFPCFLEVRIQCDRLSQMIQNLLRSSGTSASAAE